jgi:zinc protease
MAEPGLYISSKEVNQGRVTFLLPGVHRDHPDYPAIQIMNDILGGGGFTSRIMSRVRSDEGLAYGASSRFSGGVYFPRAFTAGFASKSRTVAYAASIVLEELKRIQSEPVSESEIETAKRSFIDTFPQNFGSSDRTAALFASDELTGRFAKDPQYWQLWRDRYEAVTLEDVQRTARDHLALDRLVLLVVGDREELLKGHPDYPARLQDLVPGSVHELPLRDPLTLETK